MRSVIRAALAMAASAVPLLPTASAAEPLAPGAASCRACHTAGGLPELGTLSPQEIEAALAAYRDGTRAGTVMPRIAMGFSADESRAVAESLGRTGATGR